MKKHRKTTKAGVSSPRVTAGAGEQPAIGPVRRILATFGILLLAALAGAGLLRYVVRPWQCNARQRHAEGVVLAAVRESSRGRAASSIRDMLDEIQPCIRWCGDDVNLYMIQAAGYRILERRDDAIASYETALQYDRRPEIYYNLGLTYLEADRREDAVRNLAMAARFDRTTIERIPDPKIVSEVEDQVTARRSERN